MAMKFELADTSPEMMEVWISLLRQLTPDQKISFVFEQIEFMGSLTLSDIRKKNPGISESAALRELATRRYGRELAERVYPSEPAG